MSLYLEPSISLVPNYSPVDVRDEVATPRFIATDRNAHVAESKDLVIIKEIPREALVKILSYLGSSCRDLVVSWKIARNGSVVGGISLASAPPRISIPRPIREEKRSWSIHGTFKDKLVSLARGSDGHRASF